MPRPAIVLVVDYGGSTDSGPFGEIMALACQLRGIAGLVIDGSVRDSARLAELGFPVFARGLNIRGTAKRDRGEVGEPITLGGVRIDRGDLVVADEDAVIVLPAGDAEAALFAGEARATAEARVVERLRAGETTLQILGLTEAGGLMSMIGIAGAGRMGTAFARRLVETGHEVTVWNRTPERTAQAAEAGAGVAPDLAALAARDVVVISLTDAAAVHAVADGLIAAGIGGRLVIDMSTLLPEESRAVAAKVMAAGAEFVDCPVGGTVAPALKGQLLGMAGGTEAAFVRAKPVLDQLCRRVEHLGACGHQARR